MSALLRSQLTASVAATEPRSVKRLVSEARATVSAIEMLLRDAALSRRTRGVLEMRRTYLREALEQMDGRS
jgi:hypothetical protein